MLREFFIALFLGARAHWKALFILAGLVVLAFVGFNSAIFVLSRNPRFCKTCHYEVPYYNSWKSSNHKNVSCVTCHPFEIGFSTITTFKYITNTYSMVPRAEVRDEICLKSGCHDERLLEGEVVFKGVSFNHATHLERARRGKTLHCTSCHANIVQKGHLEVIDEICFICHFKGLKSGQSISGCPSCHTGPSKIVEHEGFVFSHESYLKVGVECQQCHIKVVSGKGDVPESKCFSCHPERPESRISSNLIHDTHVKKHLIECLDCHEEIKHGEVEMISAFEVTCEKCHERLHSYQKEIYLGTSGKDVEDTPSRMFAAQVSCEGCHISGIEEGAGELRQKILESRRESCILCHDELYGPMLTNWMLQMDRLLKDFTPWFKLAQKKVARAEESGIYVEREKKLLEDASYNYNLVVEGKGVHNVEYAVKLIKSAADKVDEILKRLQSRSYPIPRDNLIGTPDGYCVDLCHTSLGLPKQLVFEHIDFPHKVHAEDRNIECTRCHSPEKHKMRVITVSECMNCHHEQQDISCTKCHVKQGNLYYGKIAAAEVKGEPDLMAEAGIECLDCHQLEEKGEILELVAAACVDCHEEGYDQILFQWFDEIQSKITDIVVFREGIKEEIKRSGLTGNRLEIVEKTLKQVESYISIVESGRGTHNQEFSMRILEMAEEKLKEIKNIIGGERNVD